MFESTRPPLSIHFTPFKPTHLSIPPSPFSPRTPLPVTKTPVLSPLPSTTSFQRTSAPSPPLSWMWQCHLCHRTYPLAATRRCLDDGHEFCSGTTTVKSWRAPLQKINKRHKACASEFDYSGWKAWGRWRRGGVTRQSHAHIEGKGRQGSNGTREKEGMKKNCWHHCDYPSECRWGRRFGIHTPLTPSFPDSVPTIPSPSAQIVDEGTQTVNPDDTQLPTSSSEKADFWTPLIASAKRRKSVGTTSPLALSTSSTSTSSSSSPSSPSCPTQSVDGDGDTSMSTPSLSPTLSTASSANSTVGFVAMNMLKDSMKRKTSRKGRSGRGSEFGGPMLTAGKSVVTKDGDGVGSGYPEVMVGEEGGGGVDEDGCSPLERAASRRGKGV